MEPHVLLAAKVVWRPLGRAATADALAVRYALVRVPGSVTDAPAPGQTVAASALMVGALKAPRLPEVKGEETPPSLLGFFCSAPAKAGSPQNTAQGFSPGAYAGGLMKNPPGYGEQATKQGRTWWQRLGEAALLVGLRVHGQPTRLDHLRRVRCGGRRSAGSGIRAGRWRKTATWTKRPEQEKGARHDCPAPSWLSRRRANSSS